MILTAVVFAVVLAADIVSKHLAAAYLAGKDAVTVIPGLIEFTYTENRGAARGMLEDHRWVFIVFSIVAIVGIVAYLVVHRPESALMRVSLAMIAGGGVGNMIERLSDKGVTDFINFQFIQFPVFNVADSFVTVGCAILIILTINDTVRESKIKKSTEKAADGGKDGGSDED